MIAGADRDFVGEWDKPILGHMLRGKGDNAFGYTAWFFRSFYQHRYRNNYVDSQVDALGFVPNWYGCNFNWRILLRRCATVLCGSFGRVYSQYKYSCDEETVGGGGEKDWLWRIGTDI